MPYRRKRIYKKKRFRSFKKKGGTRDGAAASSKYSYSSKESVAMKIKRVNSLVQTPVHV